MFKTLYLKIAFNRLGHFKILKKTGFLEKCSVALKN